MYKFKQNQIVNFFLNYGEGDIFSGKALIVGSGGEEMPVVGRMYIIKPITFTGDITIPSEIYPFECIACTENFLTAVN